jgi:nicotinate phosphoribosyltransferase
MVAGTVKTFGDLAARTDSYFLKSKEIVGRFGDREASYAVFMRRPVICAPRFAVEFLEQTAAARGIQFNIELNYPEAAWVGAGEPILYVTGSLYHLVDLETVLLQKLGPACVAAYNASAMCADLPKVAFLAMDARHCAGAEMAEMMAYAASVGSAHAKKVADAVGFVGCAAAATASYFGQQQGMGTMPHALIGYAGTTVRAAEMFHEAFPDEPLTVLVDYFGRETSDAVAVCRRFPELAAGGRLAFRMDTPGGRTEAELRYLVGTGVTAAALWRMREVLNEAGFPKSRIVASSGFGPEKCRMMAMANSPIDVIGTGSYLPELWSETYATADIIAYDGQPMVKAGREFLLRGKR